MQKKEFPILEYDSARAMIEPAEQIKRIVDFPGRCVACFFHEVLEGLYTEGRLELITEIKSALGKHPVFRLDYRGEDIAVFHPGIGAPLSAGIMEEVIAFGGEKFIACGGAGVLQEDIAVGHLIIPRLAVRDEGVSYHYVPPGREVAASTEAVRAIEEVLTRRKIDYLVGKTWTTSSFYRETPARVRLRKEEGCIVVEMESAAFFAVAAYRKVVFGQILYGGDDLSSDKWDSREWDSRTSIREKLFWLAVECAAHL